MAQFRSYQYEFNYRIIKTLVQQSMADGAKSLIALLVLIAIVSTLSPNFLRLITYSISTTNLRQRHYGVGMTLVILTSGIDLLLSLLALPERLRPQWLSG